ncbi:Inner membrane protein YiaW [Symmachiella macrocystis]|uniref:Inner membrane protein YiaW n=1 Tax=Symmachiella macrocystis TaxID=2527985 RepID=A0A5C6BPR4_9PLAN|nr:DUF3302 domain-containing protein [Symmachiella macrocystis]TWU13391.1 Inner membrane protein YiaW [Symmachiella macrocystis]
MDFLDIFALLILVVLAASLVGLWVLLGMLPGMIAKKRRHPQADAISVCGWWGAVTIGVLSPIAYVWAYTNPDWRDGKKGEPQGEGDGDQ